jgi:hypothetical protein
MSENGETKTLVVLTQEEIDTAIHGLEEVSVGIDDVYRKFHAVENEGGGERISGEVDEKENCTGNEHQPTGRRVEGHNELSRNARN